MPSIQLPWTRLNMFASLSITLRKHMTISLTMASKHKSIYPMATSLTMAKIKDIASNPWLHQEKISY